MWVNGALRKTCASYCVRPIASSDLYTFQPPRDFAPSSLSSFLFPTRLENNLVDFPSFLPSSIGYSLAIAGSRAYR